MDCANPLRLRARSPGAVGARSSPCRTPRSFAPTAARARAARPPPAGARRPARPSAAQRRRAGIGDCLSGSSRPWSTTSCVWSWPVDMRCARRRCGAALCRSPRRALDRRRRPRDLARTCRLRAASTRAYRTFRAPARFRGAVACRTIPQRSSSARGPKMADVASLSVSAPTPGTCRECSRRPSRYRRRIAPSRCPRSTSSMLSGGRDPAASPCTARPRALRR
mmetsp:Transcript_42204/g.122446  ORF Transcript_42204/g.122446 Transcript_42204/m.122446 type:complete len:223 (+) Transcript_42204:609-1277(+)